MSRFDHLVLPVADLTVARKRYEDLGFIVAPDGRHPFGTANCCVYFGEGSFLEPLAVADESQADAAIRKGNVFVGHDATYRSRVGQEGLSALVVASDDAAHQHELFQAEGISGGAVLDFTRPVRDPAGQESEAAFRLAFAKDLRAPDTLFFACERRKVPAVDRSALTAHPNGVEQVAKVTLTAPQPRLFETFLQHAIGGECRTDGEAFLIDCGTVLVEVVTPAMFGSRCADLCQAPADPTLQFASVTFACRDLSLLRDKALLSPVNKDDGLAAPAGEGQGVPFFFEQAR